jgi:hypothetical protein
MDTGYTFDINNCEITYTSPLEDGFIPVEDEE